jgi:chaperone modulatory protein CbpM
MELREFLSLTHIEAEAVHAWVEAGWLLPDREGATEWFSEVDLARAQLIRDLTHDLGVNDEGIPVILDLIDQLHGLRHVLRELLSTIDAQPQAKRRHMIEALRETALGELDAKSDDASNRGADERRSS